MGKKVNTERTDEALASASDTLAVGCPFCNIMLSDGIMERHAEEQMTVRDVAQLLLQSIDFHPESSTGKARGNGNGARVGADDYPATKEEHETTGTPAGPGDAKTT
jgi:hypothetical protein